MEQLAWHKMPELHACCSNVFGYNSLQLPWAAALFSWCVQRLAQLVLSRACWQRKCICWHHVSYHA